MHALRKICTECGEPFSQTHGGRPRAKCYECKPARLHQRKSKLQAGGQNHAQAVKPADGQAQPQESRKCGWCQAYLPPGTDEAFCNPNHRAQMVEKVARERERQDRERAAAYKRAHINNRGQHRKKEIANA